MSLRVPRPLASVALVLSASLALAACGDMHARVTTGTYAGEGGANAPYLDVGPLSYQVQQSRQLNPANAEDAAYLQGLSPAEQQLAPDQVWFGVFLQVYNNSNQVHQAAVNITLSDAQGGVYLPVVPNPTNLYAYRPVPVPANTTLPLPDTPAANGGTQGAVVLYKISVSSYDNRPLELKIINPANATDTASAELDV
jgi:hypothetical protein